MRSLLLFVLAGILAYAQADNAVASLITDAALSSDYFVKYDVRSNFTPLLKGDTLCVTATARNTTIPAISTGSFKLGLSVDGRIYENIADYRILETGVVKQTPKGICGTIEKNYDFSSTFAWYIQFPATFRYPSYGFLYTLSVYRDDTVVYTSNRLADFTHKTSLRFEISSQGKQRITYYATKVPSFTTQPVISHALEFPFVNHTGLQLKTELDLVTSRYCEYKKEFQAVICPLEKFCVDDPSNPIPYICAFDLNLDIYTTLVARQLQSKTRFITQRLFWEDKTTSTWPTHYFHVVDNRVFGSTAIRLRENYDVATRKTTSLDIVVGDQKLITGDHVYLYLNQDSYMQSFNVYSTSPYVKCQNNNMRYVWFLCNVIADKSGNPVVLDSFTVAGLDIDASGSTVATVGHSNLKELSIDLYQTLGYKSSYFNTNCQAKYCINQANLTSVHTAPNTTVQEMAFNFDFINSSTFNSTHYIRIRYDRNVFIPRSIAPHVAYGTKRMECYNGTQLNVLPPTSQLQEFYCPIHNKFEAPEYPGNFKGSIFGLSFNTTLISRRYNQFGVLATIVQIPVEASPQKPVPSEQVFTRSNEDVVFVKHIKPVVAFPKLEMTAGTDNFGTIQKPNNMVITFSGLKEFMIKDLISVDFSSPILIASKDPFSGSMIEDPEYKFLCTYTSQSSFVCETINTSAKAVPPVLSLAVPVNNVPFDKFTTEATVKMTAYNSTLPLMQSTTFIQIKGC